ncbi:hypothetical protein CVD28_00025 [Bacillus sp. M6-12]|nr:hypothetical protein CVD28_00025 [Bacillus sp. M6-12]
MEQLLEGNLPSIAKSLERIANALESTPVENVKTIQEIVKEEIQDIQDNVSPEELFLQKVENLHSAFKDVVDSFANGEAKNVNYMEKYPFEAFSVVELSLSVQDWVGSIRHDVLKKED